MMLVDTSVWVDHFRRGNPDLGARLEAGLVWCHPFVIGEIAFGRLSERAQLLGLLEALPCPPVADHSEVLALIDRRELDGSGIGWVDAHLLASAMLGRIGIWTLDRTLDRITRRLGIRFQS
ncbi:MAG: PIN domain-containing protein [Gemmatimonadetes bacterium]|nr:PIN domain-containing protein [Gemmatimonadota bacterium]